MPERDWIRDGECRRSGLSAAELDVMFFPPLQSNYDEARAMCTRCAVRDDCLEAALASGEEYGMWGGHTPRERLAILRARRRRAAA